MAPTPCPGLTPCSPETERRDLLWGSTIRICLSGNLGGIALFPLTELPGFLQQRPGLYISVPSAP